jgi:hypothetical protein
MCGSDGNLWLTAANGTPVAGAERTYRWVIDTKTGELVRNPAPEPVQVNNAVWWSYPTTRYDSLCMPEDAAVAAVTAPDAAPPSKAAQPLPAGALRHGWGR